MAARRQALQAALRAEPSEPDQLVPSLPLKSARAPDSFEHVSHDCGCWEERCTEWTYSFGRCMEHGA